jgi:small conductance mechanosensitive channel
VREAKRLAGASPSDARATVRARAATVRALQNAARNLVMETEALLQVLYQKGVDVGGKILGVLVLWVIGRFVIRTVKALLERSLRARAVEKTLIGYADNIVTVLLNILLVAVLLGFVGVETTTFAGLLAAAGLAIGTAWSGLLANFAAGAFLVVLRPFRKGDFVSAGGFVGTVADIGMFVTTIDTMDNVRTMVGNGKIFSEPIQNFTLNPYRRVDRSAQLAHGADHAKAIAILQAEVAKIPNVVATPAPDIVVLDFNLAGPVLAVRPYCHNDHYWQVYFDTNRTIRDALGAAGFAVPQTHHHVEGTASAAT